jgi:signal peptidase II
MSSLIGPFTRLGWLWAIGIFILDQSHKWWMLLVYKIEEKGRVALTPFLDLVFVKNLGVSYGMFATGSQSGQIALAAFAGFSVLALTLWLARGEMNRLLAISIGLIMGGALGNALDRLLLGGVADFFSMHAFGFYWYVFNIADIAIVAGVIGLLYESYGPSRGAASKAP